MNNRLIQKGDLIEDNGQLFNVHEIRLQTDQILLEGAVGNLVFYGVSEFNNRVAQGLTKPVYSRRAANEEGPTRELSTSEKAALKVRLDVLAQVKNLREQGVPWQDIGPMLGKNARGMRTIQRWYSKYVSVVNKKLVAPCYSARGNRGSKLSEVTEQALQETLLDFFKESERFSITAITELVNTRAREICAGLKLPFSGVSRRSVTRAIYKIGNLESVKDRLDSRTVRQILHASMELLRIEAPYERVEYDSTVLNVHIVNEHGVVIGKPTLYLLIDCATGAIIAFYLTIQAESEETFLRLLEMAFMPRDESFLQRYGVKQALPAPALWHKQCGDNSAAHHGQAMYHALWYLGVANEFSQAGKPQSHPYVERTHGSMKTGLIKKLCGANLSEEVLENDPEGRALREAALTLPQLEKLVARWICDVYMVVSGSFRSSDIDGLINRLKSSAKSSPAAPECTVGLQDISIKSGLLHADVVSVLQDISHGLIRPTEVIPGAVGLAALRFDIRDIQAHQTKQVTEPMLRISDLVTHAGWKRDDIKEWIQGGFLRVHREQHDQQTVERIPLSALTEFLTRYIVLSDVSDALSTTTNYLLTTFKPAKIQPAVSAITGQPPARGLLVEKLAVVRGAQLRKPLIREFSELLEGCP
ncbi:MAG: hypothetical protein E6Q69_02745 [Aquipseudomonas alcaligenes]|uniref:Integrase catalytic domain-containing protein n=1 Tax=Aquipseudomonas alcaligenes TaxID=43263 RepID=A0A5C7WEL6_AQUAC|nr:MAG: hypothetical protein E6Q69_02745 [Pseudomonas alcaligenes]